MPDRSAARSLAVRLSWWYGLSSCLLIAIVTGFLYLALLRNFDQQNECYLTEKVSILRTAGSTPSSLSSTNVIELAFSIVETVYRNVKRWRGGDQIECWVGSGLLVAEQ